MLASPDRRKRGLSSHVRRNGASTAVATVNSPPSGALRYVGNSAPAAWTSPSSRSCREATCAASASTASASTMSKTAGSTPAPAPTARQRQAASSVRLLSRPTSHTEAPSRASSSAAARPIPEEAPVTMTTRPVRSDGGPPVLEAAAREDSRPG